MHPTHSTKFVSGKRALKAEFPQLCSPGLCAEQEPGPPPAWGYAKATTKRKQSRNKAASRTKRTSTRQQFVFVLFRAPEPVPFPWNLYRFAGQAICEQTLGKARRNPLVVVRFNSRIPASNDWRAHNGPPKSKLNPPESGQNPSRINANASIPCEFRKTATSGPAVEFPYLRRP